MYLMIDYQTHDSPAHHVTCVNTLKEQRASIYADYQNHDSPDATCYTFWRKLSHFFQHNNNKFDINKKRTSEGKTGI